MFGPESEDLHSTCLQLQSLCLSTKKTTILFEGPFLTKNSFDVWFYGRFE